jgi:transposase-like protein
MPRSVIDEARFRDEKAAYAYVEAMVWPNGRVCPHCGVVDKSGALKGNSTRIGVYKCYACRKPFTVKVGTIFEKSHVQMHVWLQAMHLMCSSKKGISSNQLSRILGCDLKTAWFISHRIREAMAPASGEAGPLGGKGKIVEADETYLSKSPKTRRKAPVHAKSSPQVMSLVERGGAIRSMFLDGTNIRSVLWQHLDQNSHLYTDGAVSYKGFMPYGRHASVDHSKEEWVRKLPDGSKVHTNTLEGFFSIFKRGLVGVYQHVDEKHLHRYLAEFDFRYNNRIARGVNDVERTERAIRGIVGKRLTYRTTNRETDQASSA